MIDVVKVLIGLVLYLGLAPAYGFFCATRPKWIRYNLLFTAFCTSMPHSDWTLQVLSMERYRGHTRGFEINLLVALSLSSIIAMGRNRSFSLRLWPPGMVSYLLYVCAATATVFVALEPSYVLMSTLKYGSVALVYVAVFNSIRNVRDLRALQNTLAVALIWQLILCMKFKYVDGIYRAKGNFPHSNNLGMYSYMVALFLLAALTQLKVMSRRALLLAGGYLCGMALALITISRASFAAAIGGTGLVFALSLALRPGAKKVGLALVLLVPLSIGVAIVSDQLLERTLGAASTHNEEFGDLRDAMEEQAKAMLRDHPFGIGWNNFCVENSEPDGHYADILADFTLKVEGYQVSEEHARRNPLIENFYWMVLGETGYLAFALFALFQLSIWWPTVRSLRFFRTNEIGAVPISMTIVLTVLYAHFVVERIVADTPVMLMFFILAAVATRVAEWRVRIVGGQLTLAQVLGERPRRSTGRPERPA